MANVLIIDDDPALRSTMRRILERDGHSVREADNGDTGVRLFRAERPDVVVTDLFMPEKEGIETIQEISEEAPDVPILAVSGGGAIEPGGPLMDAELLGATATLAKPFSVEDLQGAVRRLLEGGRPGGEDGSGPPGSDPENPLV